MAVAHHNTDLWRVAAPVDGARWGLWPVGAARLSTHLFEHYDFGGDTAFLRKAYDVMKEASEFLLDFLVEGEQGWLVTNPSPSTENAFLDEKGNEGVLCVGATMDFGIIRELFGDSLRAARILGEDAEFRTRLERALDRLPPYQIGRHGQLQEWLKDFDEAEPGHRHISHLFAPPPGPLDHAAGHAGAREGGTRLARAPSRERGRRHGLEPRLDRQPLRAARRRRQGVREPDGAAREIHPAQPVRQPPALPDRRQLRRHRGDRGDAAAEPRGRAGPAARASAGVAGARARGGAVRSRRAVPGAIRPKGRPIRDPGGSIDHPGRYVADALMSL